MAIERVAYDADDKPVEYSTDLFRGDRTRVIAWAHGRGPATATGTRRGSAAAEPTRHMRQARIRMPAGSNGGLQRQSRRRSAARRSRPGSGPGRATRGRPCRRRAARRSRAAPSAPGVPERGRADEPHRLAVAQQQLAAPRVGLRVGHHEAGQAAGDARRPLLLDGRAAAERDGGAELARERQAGFDRRGVRAELPAERAVALLQPERLDRVVAGEPAAATAVARVGEPLERGRPPSRLGT